MKHFHGNIDHPLHSTTRYLPSHRNAYETEDEEEEETKISILTTAAAVSSIRMLCSDAVVFLLAQHHLHSADYAIKSRSNEKIYW